MTNGSAALGGIVAGLMLLGFALIRLIWLSSYGGTDDGMMRTLLIMGTVMLLGGLWSKWRASKRR